MSQSNVAAASALLGCKIDEVADVSDAPAGTVITTTDGTAYVNASEPDAEGKTGLMIFEPKHSKAVMTVDGVTTWNEFPVYVNEIEEAGDVDAEGSAPDAPASSPDGGDLDVAEITAEVMEMEPAELKAHVDELGLEVDRRKVGEMREALVAARIRIARGEDPKAEEEES